MSDFDRIAPVYDGLSSIIFGKSIRKAQTQFLNYIRPGGKVLILGGGTGWILTELTVVNPTCKVWHIEASAKMLELSRRRHLVNAENVISIHGTEDSIPDDVIYDAVITNFYLDLYTTDACRTLISRIATLIDKNGLWFVSDFQRTTWWQSAMLSVMYYFFKIVANLRPQSLPQWRELLIERGFMEVRFRNFYANFIRSSLFQLIPEKM
jgi:ubiquinone/menaquinone biosynthesis C-methylase UbiE